MSQVSRLFDNDAMFELECAALGSATMDVSANSRGGIS